MCPKSFRSRRNWVVKPVSRQIENSKVCYDGRPEAHYHLRCQHTGEVRDLSLPYDPQLVHRLAPQLVEELRRQGFEITGHRLEHAISLTAQRGAQKFSDLRLVLDDDDAGLSHHWR